MERRPALRYSYHLAVTRTITGDTLGRSGSDRGPLEGVRVVEVSLGMSLIGAGMAGSLPGALLRDLGADVARVQLDRPSELDRGVEFSRVWDRDKALFEVPPDAPSGVVSDLVRHADVALLSGPESLLERQGIGTARADPRATRG